MHFSCLYNPVPELFRKKNHLLPLLYIYLYLQAPHLSWRDVVLELDHAGFIVLNKRGFRILIQGLIRGLQEVFPVEFIYRPWKNTEGQVSWVDKYQCLICLAC